MDASSPSAKEFSPAWSADVSAAVFAQPLVVGHQVIVADESDHVTAYDSGSGSQLWSQALGTPVPKSALPCGDIDPTGITGTPVADVPAARLWVVAFLTDSQGVHHQLIALDLASGAVVTRREIDPPGVDPHLEQQRGALALANGYVYVPYGGLFGDCGNYAGYIVGAPLSSSEPDVVFRPNVSRGAGIWYPAGPVVVGGGEILTATGNGQQGSDQGNSVILLSQQLGTIGSFTPGDSQSLDDQDLDLGSTDPVLLGAGRLFIAGKQGTGYLLSLPSLGVGNAQLSQGTVCDGQAIGGNVVYRSMIYVSCSDGLTALRVSGNTFSRAWSAGSGLAGPPIVSGGLVWFMDIDTGTLIALDPASGAVRQSVTLGTASHFTSPAAAGGKLFVVAGEKLQAFDE